MNKTMCIFGRLDARFTNFITGVLAWLNWQTPISAGTCASQFGLLQGLSAYRPAPPDGKRDCRFHKSHFNCFLLLAYRVRVRQIADWLAHTHFGNNNVNCALKPQPSGPSSGESSVAILEGSVHRTGAAGTIQSVRYRDPDGNLIEVSSYKKT